MVRPYCRTYLTDSPDELRTDLSAYGVNSQISENLIRKSRERLICLGPLTEQNRRTLLELTSNLRIPLECARDPFRTDYSRAFATVSNSDVLALAERLRSANGTLAELADSLEDSVRPPKEFRISCRGTPLTLGKKTAIMGILNVTPDSFSDGGKYLEKEQAVEHAREMIKQGADIIDVGAESTRPGSLPIGQDVEIGRIVPIVEELRTDGAALISVDTYKPAVAEAALQAGAHMINDISGLTFSPDLAAVAASHGAPMILMHIKGTPRTMQENPRYIELVGEIIDRLSQSLERAFDNGLKPEQTIIDPGIGFGKTVDHNLTLLRRLKEFRALSRPILVGPSRKSFIGGVLDLPVEERLEGTLAAVAAAALGGADVVRVHDVEEAKRVVQLTDAINTSGRNRS